MQTGKEEVCPTGHYCKEDDVYHDLPNIKQGKKNSVLPATTIDQFLKQQGIVIGDKRKQVNHTEANVECMHTPHSIHEHNKSLDE